VDENKNMEFTNAVVVIKEAIVRARYQAAALVNRELLGLYYAVGKYVSDNSRRGYWGQGAVKRISVDLQKELPGLRGFSESSIRLMRLFHEEWQSVLSNHQLTTDEMQISEKNENIIDLNLLFRHTENYVADGFSADEFLRVGFTHHSEILAKEKSLEGRLFYISRCAAEFWSVNTRQ